MIDLNTAHVLLTGASSGIGAALAHALARAGARLTLVARREDRLRAVAEACPGDAHRVQPADLADLDGIAPLVERAVDELGPIDALINNAGVQIVAPTARTSNADGEWLLRVDTLAPFRLIQATLQPMIDRGRGSIVNIASVAALAPTAGMFYYSAAKAALAGASEALGSELRGSGVHVMTVYPGPVATDMAATAVKRYAKDPTGGLPMGSTEVLARRIVKGMRRGQRRLIYPRAYAITRALPGTTRFVMDRLTPPLVDD